MRVWCTRGEGGGEQQSPPAPHSAGPQVGSLRRPGAESRGPRVSWGLPLSREIPPSGTLPSAPCSLSFILSPALLCFWAGFLGRGSHSLGAALGLPSLGPWPGRGRAEGLLPRVQAGWPPEQWARPQSPCCHFGRDGPFAVGQGGTGGLLLRPEKHPFLRQPVNTNGAAGEEAGALGAACVFGEMSERMCRGPCPQYVQGHRPRLGRGHPGAAQASCSQTEVCVGGGGGGAPEPARGLIRRESTSGARSWATAP